MANLKNLNRFEHAPVNLDIQRSRFHMPHTHKTTFSSGKLVPIGLFEVLPSDTFEIDLSSVVRMVTPVVPTMDNSFLDVYAFYVPNRIATLHPKDWEKICGENTNGYWAPYEEATLLNTENMENIAGSVFGPNSIAAYFGLPIGTIPDGDKYVTLLPLHGYTAIWNEWFRDQNTQAPLTFAEVVYEGELFSVNKFHDYFTSCLPSPQKGPAVSLPLGISAPVITTESENFDIGPGLRMRTTDGSFPAAGSTLTVNPLGSSNDVIAMGGTAPSGSTQQVHPSNLAADLSTATAATINQLRQAFAIQRMYEKDARGGSRYREILRNHYGSNIPDSTIQIPQYLGGKRIPLNITQVLQTSSTNETSPLGSTGAFSNSSFSDKICTKSFDEHGFIHVVACVRTSQTYSQGLAKFWTRNRRFDWYYPSFANLGEQAVYTRELYLDDERTTPFDQVFGYQEAWAEYRYLPNRVSGYLAPGANDLTLTAWTYTNDFTAPPVLNSDFMIQSESQIAATLAVQDVDYQFIADFYFDMSVTRAMPTYSIPGLIDHH